MAKIDDQQLVGICENEIRNSTGIADGEISTDRAKALDRYLGKPRGDEQEGRSKVVTREVLDAIEWMKPSLMRIFANSDNVVQFEPATPEDEKQAELESDFVSDCYWQKNQGFYNTLTFITDGLLGKVGCLKADWTQGEDSREEYQGLTEFELSELLNDSVYEREILEWEDGGFSVEGAPLINATFLARERYGHVEITPCPPEEIGVNRDMRSPYAKDATFFRHTTRKTRSQLLQAGYPRDKVERLPWNNDSDTAERLARRNYSDEQDTRFGHHESVGSVWVTECYIRIDRDDDGYDELLKVTLGGSDGMSTGAGVLLDVEEVDKIPFYTFSPILLAHKFHGLSIADLVIDLEEQQTTLLRNILDNVYLTNNQRNAVDEDRVDLDDMLTNRPGGIVRVKGDSPVQQALMPLQTGQMDPNVWQLKEALDERRKQRTGVGDEVAALDVKALGDMNTGVASLMFDAARSKIELIARIIAEIGLRPLFEDIRELYAKNYKGEMVAKLRGEWVAISPADWRRRDQVTVTVGLGRTSTERKLMALSDVIAKQAEALAGGLGGVLVTPQHVYAAATDYTKLLGMDASKYWMNPQDAPPPAPPQVDPMIEIQGRAVEVQAQRNQLDAQKLQIEAQAKARELEIKAQAEAERGEIMRLKSQIEWNEQLAKKQQGDAKLELQAEIAGMQDEVKRMQLALDDSQAAHDRELEQWKTLVQLSGSMTVEQAQAMGGMPIAQIGQDIESRAQESVAKQLAEMQAQHKAEMTALRQELNESRHKPAVFKRDKNGLVTHVDDMPVLRDAAGRIERVG